MKRLYFLLITIIILSGCSQIFPEATPVVERIVITEEETAVSEIITTALITETENISESLPYTEDYQENQENLTEEDTALPGNSEKQLGMSLTGFLKTLAESLEPNLFIYRRDYANEIFGTDDAGFIAEHFTDIKKIEAAAKYIDSFGYYLLCSADDLKKLLPPDTEDPEALTEQFTENEYIGNLEYGSNEWRKQFQKEGQTFAFVVSPLFFYILTENQILNTESEDWAAITLTSDF
ncbi:MAG: hypothetical protein LBM87_05145 [Ruminococcus sp.]|jgi:hypothetical protein|nr:hypothetical protein [Ruminococcus sp.]